jgi:hypothetical protein
VLLIYGPRTEQANDDGVLYPCNLAYEPSRKNK